MERQIQDNDALDGDHFAEKLQDVLGALIDNTHGFIGESATEQADGALANHANTNNTFAKGIIDRRLFIGAQKLLDTAAHVGQSEEEQNIRRELSLAMTGEPVLDTPDITSTITYSQEATPDYSKCPDGWLQRGSVCYADDAHAKSGTCGARMDLGSMSTEQKLAFERFCNVQFPRAAVGSCDVDFEEACPSQWREVDENLCQAPDNYYGTCNPLLNTQGMTAEDKQRFGIQCGASWPCSVPPPRNYEPACPIGWHLQVGSVCKAPSNYNGQCAESFNADGLSIGEKQHLEDVCNVSWPSSHRACKRNYNAPCPFGWRGGTTEPGAASCTAPTTYTKCGRVQDFEHMSPWEKQEWEIACDAPFPCIDRSE